MNFNWYSEDFNNFLDLRMKILTFKLFIVCWTVPVMHPTNVNLWLEEYIRRFVDKTCRNQSMSLSRSTAVFAVCQSHQGRSNHEVPVTQQSSDQTQLWFHRHISSQWSSHSQHTEIRLAHLVVVPKARSVSDGPIDYREGSSCHILSTVLFRPWCNN